jgi:hypothetical protein
LINTAPNQILLVDYRFGGSSSQNGDFLRVSGNNGNTFGSAIRIGTIDPNGGIVFGPGTNLSGVGINSGAQYQRMPLAGIADPPPPPVSASFSDPFAPLSYSSVALSGTTIPYIGYGSSSVAGERHYDGSGEQNSTVNWTVFAGISGADADREKLAGGPSGLVYTYRQNHFLQSRKLVGSSFSGTAATIAGTGADIDENDAYANQSSGHFVTAYKDFGPEPNALRLARSTDGTSWSAPETVVNAPDVTGAKALQVATAPDDQGFMVWDNGSGAIMASTLDPVPAGGGGPGPGPGPTAGPPATAPTGQIGHAAEAANVLLQFFGPKSCVSQGQKVQLKLTGKQRKKLPKVKRGKLVKVVFALDKKKKTDKKSPMKQNFSTAGFAKGSKHKISAKAYVTRKKPTKKTFVRTRKGTFTMCS